MLVAVSRTASSSFLTFAPFSSQDSLHAVGRRWRKKLVRIGSVGLFVSKLCWMQPKWSKWFRKLRTDNVRLQVEKDIERKVNGEKEMAARSKSRTPRTRRDLSILVPLFPRVTRDLHLTRFQFACAMNIYLPIILFFFSASLYSSWNSCKALNYLFTLRFTRKSRE